MNPDTVPKICSAFCYWAGIACWAACAYLLVLAPIEYVAFGIVAFGAAVGLQLIAAVMTRKRNAAQENAADGEPPG